MVETGLVEIIRKGCIGRGGRTYFACNDSEVFRYIESCEKKSHE